MNQSISKTEIKRTDFMSTGILFLFFAVTLFLYGGGKLVIPIFGITLAAPDWLNTILNIVTYIVIGLSGLISLICLIGIFIPKGMNTLLLRVKNSKLGVAKTSYYQLYYWAILLNFFISWLRGLSALATKEPLFYSLFSVGLIWVIAIFIAIPGKYRNDG